MLTIKLTASTTSDFCFFSPIPGAALLAQFIRPLYKCPVGVSNWVQTKASSCSNTFISSFLDFDERRKSSSFRPSSLDRILIQSDFSAKRFCTIESSLYPLGSYRKRVFILLISRSLDLFQIVEYGFDSIVYNQETFLAQSRRISFAPSELLVPQIPNTIHPVISSSQ